MSHRNIDVSVSLGRLAGWYCTACGRMKTNKNNKLPYDTVCGNVTCLLNEERLVKAYCDAFCVERINLRAVEIRAYEEFGSVERFCENYFETDMYDEITCSNDIFEWDNGEGYQITL